MLAHIVAQCVRQYIGRQITATHFTCGNKYDTGKLAAKDPVLEPYNVCVFNTFLYSLSWRS